jgi:NADPH:quinone reductase-like Zn-dependent oxidoreductase
MKQYRLESGGEGQPLQVQLVEGAEVAQPQAGEVLIRVRACSLNYRDLLMLAGQSGSGGGGSVVPISDGAGEVAAIGNGVTQFAVGERVAGCFFSDWQSGRFEMRYHKAALGGSTDGMLSEYVVLPETGVVAMPDHLSFEEAACLPCAAVTAWHALFVRGGLSEGDTVLALGTGGVSIFALQLATAAGAKVLVTSSSDEKLERAKSMAAWQVINYRTHEDWDAEVWRLTEKRGVDHVVEVGGPGTLGRSMKSVAAGGNIALIGVLTGKGASDDSLFPMVTKNADLNAIYVGNREMFEQLNGFLVEHQIRPVIDRSFAFEEAPAAYDYLRSGAHFGKVVIRGVEGE